MLPYPSIFFFWYIGKKVYEEKDHCLNVIQRYSDYYSYFYGNSFLFTRENIHFMKRFYMNYPIYYKKLELFSWKHYQFLLSIPNKKERTFYYSLSLFFQSSYEELLDMVYNNYYLRI